MEQVAKYKMTILRTAFSLSVDIYVRETKQRIGEVNRRKKPRHKDVTKKEVQRRTKKDSTEGREESGRRREVKKSKHRTRKKNR